MFILASEAVTCTPSSSHREKRAVSTSPTICLKFKLTLNYFKYLRELTNLSEYLVERLQDELDEAALALLLPFLLGEPPEMDQTF